MNIKLLAKIGIISGSILMGAFLLFLLLPLGLNFFIDKYTPQIVGEINKATGLSAGLEEVRVVATPKLTAGLKVKKFELYTPQTEPIFISDNFENTLVETLSLMFYLKELSFQEISQLRQALEKQALVLAVAHASEEEPHLARLGVGDDFRVDGVVYACVKAACDDAYIAELTGSVFL